MEPTLAASNLPMCGRLQAGTQPQYEESQFLLDRKEDILRQSLP